MSRETSISDARKPATPEDLARTRATLDSGEAPAVARAILDLYLFNQDEFKPRDLLNRFALHEDTRVRMAAVDFMFVEKLRVAEDPQAAEVELLAELMPRFQDDLYVTRCLVNRVVQHRLSNSAPMLLQLLPGFPRPEWLLTAYGAIHPFNGYPPLRDALLAAPGAEWAEEALKHLYRLDPAAAVRDFPRYLPGLPDKKLWRVLEALGYEMTAEYVPLLERLVRERDARVRRVGVSILRWLAGEERATASYAALPISAVERQELDAVVRARPGGPKGPPARPS